MDCHNARAKAVSCKLQVDSRADERDDALATSSVPYISVAQIVD